ncbi:hypothetical protein BDA99DRAFT_535619 [Phascolomyces articulosus]|uniref:Uncharacterized protein n=1 Tax=Phascolomyces articulosus TaxID=60185 RepID=A0AAD5K3L5_9FUNG|nr:hypothetical protein BDA99DRAFT_535619 [Phascolomyces articulosus]
MVGSKRPRKNKENNTTKTSKDNIQPSMNTINLATVPFKPAPNDDQNEREKAHGLNRWLVDIAKTTSTGSENPTIKVTSLNMLKKILKQDADPSTLQEFETYNISVYEIEGFPKGYEKEINHTAGSLSVTYGNIHESLPAEYLILTVILASDVTNITKDGTKSAYPLYFKLGNIPTKIRENPTHKASCY